MPLSSTAWILWLIASIFYSYQYILRVMPSIMLTDISQRFDIDSALFGQFSGVYYLGYAFFHIPIGIMLDRFGPRKVMSVCILLTVIGMLPILFSHNWTYPVIGRALVGIGSSAAILGTFKIIRLRFSEQRFTRMLSLSVTIGLLGAIYGGRPLNYLCHILGYESVIQLFCGFGVALALLTYVIIPDAKVQPSHSILVNLKTVFTHKKVLMVCIFSGFMVGPLEGFADVWGGGFLKQVYGLNSANASFLTSMIFVGMCFGAPVLSFIAEKCNNFLTTIALTGLTMMMCFIILLWSLDLAVWFIALLFIVVGICSAYQILAIYQASTYVADEVVGLTTAVANMIIMSFGYAVHSAIGLIIHVFGKVNLTQAYIYGIAVIPMMLAVGTLGFIMLLLSSNKKSSY